METRDMPEIRFENDHEEWKHRKLEDVAKFSTGECVTGSDCLLHGRFQIIGGGMLPMGYINWKNRNKDTVTIAKIGSAGFVGWQKTDFFLTNNCFSVVPNDEIDSEFLYHNLKQKETEIARMKWQTSIPYISVQSLGDLSVEFPSLPVQREIADLFSSLDRKLAAEQKKLAALKMAKHALLVKIFPREGETVPEIRFEGFSHPWEQRKLRDISSLITKGTTPLDKSGAGDVNFIKVENLDSNSGEVISGSKISMDEHEGYLKRSQLKAGDILFSIAGTLGRVGIIKSSVLPANTNQALAIIRTKEGNINYISTVLRGRAVTDFIHRNPTVGAQPNLSLEQVGNLEIPYPSLDEQEKIGDYFKRLDNLITLHQRKCDKLRQAKSALLNQMFV